MIDPGFYQKEIVPGPWGSPYGAPPAAAEAGASGPGPLVDVVETEVDLYYRMAVEMYRAIQANNAAGRGTVFIVPVGPTFQYRRFVYLCREMPIDLSGLHLFFMDEYLADATLPGAAGSGPPLGAGAAGAPRPGVDSHSSAAPGPALIDIDSPLSFRGFVHRELVEPLMALDGGSEGEPSGSGSVSSRNGRSAISGSAGASTGRALNFSPDQIYFPDPADPDAYDRRLADLGGADICFAGVGINGHLAFNEPPPEEQGDFFNLGTRIVHLSRETITINSNTALGGAWEQIPKQAITVGMKQILASKSLRIFLNRPWQRAVVRKLLYGPVTSTFPASSAQQHADARITMTAEVAAPPQFALR
jgi:glucosamine-6-phosphate deaminase